MKKAVCAELLVLILLPGICLSTVSPPLSLDFDPPWALIESRENTKIYQHPWPYSGISTFKVDTVLDASMNEILTIITDIDSYPRWVPNCLKAEMLETTENKSIVYYMAVDMPWPAADRDWVNQLTILPSKDDTHITITFSAYDNFLPPKANFIRVTRHIASWTLISANDTQTRSIWQWHTDPGGNLPNWLIEWAARSQVMESLENIKKVLKK